MIYYKTDGKITQVA